jgi:hypothetical protein
MKIQLKKQFIFVIPAMMGLTIIQAQNAPVKQEPGINVANMDKKIKPNDDFFRFVNGSWLDKTEIQKPEPTRYQTICRM